MFEGLEAFLTVDSTFLLGGGTASVEGRGKGVFVFVFKVKVDS